MTYHPGFNIGQTRRELGFMGNGSTYPISKGYIAAENVDGRYVLNEQGGSWLKIGNANPQAVFERKGELDDRFFNGAKLTVVRPEIIAVEALRLDSWYNQRYRSMEHRRVNAMLFAGSVAVGDTSVPVVGVHAFGEKNQGLLVPTPSNEHSEYALTQLSQIAAVGRDQVQWPN